MGGAVDAPPDELLVWPEHADAWDIWLCLQNAWSAVAGMAGIAWLGFDRTQAESIMRMRGIKRRHRGRVLERLLVMEAAALPIMNAKRA